MEKAPVVPVMFRVASNQPATVEVTMDPTAHGPSGVGPFQRGINLTAEDGRLVEIVLSGTIVR